MLVSPFNDSESIYVSKDNLVEKLEQEMKELDGRRKLNDVDFSKPDEEAKDPPSPRFDYRTKEVRT